MGQIVTPGQKTISETANTQNASIPNKTAVPKSQIKPNIVESSSGSNTPATVKDYSPKENDKLPEGVPQGYKGIRKTLNERGVSDGRIGFNNGYVTIDNQQMYRPEYNINGTTYADETAINQMTQQAYNMSKNPLVATRDYVTSKGYGGAVNWDGENPTIGGEPIRPTYITSDGISYIPQSEADRLIAEFENKNKINTNQGVLESRDKKYGSIEENALNKLLNRDEFSYNPETDPAYQAYKKQYDKAAEKALRRILNDNNTSLEGASGAVLSEALAAQNEQLDRATDMIPELYEAAYNRYIGEDNRLRENLNDIEGVADSFYRRNYQANRDQTDDTYRSLQAERENDQRLFENDITRRNDERDADTHSVNLEADRIKNDYNREAYNKLLFDNAVSKALQRGFFTKDDENLLPWLKNYRNADGTYSINPYDAEVKYDSAKLNAEYNARAAAYQKYGKDIL